MADRKEWVEKTKAKIDEWDRTVGEFEERMSTVSDEARAEYQERLAVAKRHLAGARGDLTRAREAGSDRWKELEKDVTETWKTTRNMLERSLEELRKVS